MTALGRPKEEDHPVFNVSELQRGVEVNLNCRINLIRKKKEKKKERREEERERRKKERRDRECLQYQWHQVLYV